MNCRITVKSIKGMHPRCTSREDLLDMTIEVDATCIEHSLPELLGGLTDREAFEMVQRVFPEFFKREVTA